MASNDRRPLNCGGANGVESSEMKNKTERVVKPGSINDKKLGPTLSVGAVRLCVVRDLVTHAWLQRELSPVFEFGMKLPFRTKKDMALDTPMVGKVSRRILNHANSNCTCLLYNLTLPTNSLV
jgi:hypothetical protein